MRQGIRRRAGGGALLTLLIISFTHPSVAQTSGRIALRGVVPTKAAFQFATSTAAMAVDLESVEAHGTTLEISSASNYKAGLALSIASQNARRETPVLVSDSEPDVSYRVRYGNKDLRFTDGQAVITRVHRPAETSRPQTLRILAPPLPRGSRAAYSDRLVLVVTAP